MTLVALVAALASCSRDGGKSSDGRAIWFQLQASGFSKIAGARAIAPVEPLPWTVQTRVTDEAFYRDALYLAVNGRGIAAIDLSGQEPGFHTFYDDMIFSHRTLTALVPRQGALTCHLYFNEVLNTVKPSDLALAGISLVNFFPALSEYGFLFPSFQQWNRDWESVGFLAVGADDFLFEWKRTKADETSFLYTRFNPATGKEVEVSRELYKSAFPLSSEPAARINKARFSLFELCFSKLPARQPDSAVHFLVRSRRDSLKTWFRTGEGASITSIPIFEEESGSFALLPGGTVLCVPSGSPQSSIALPKLPEKFHYTDVVRAGDYLILPWEQTLFTNVGAAGVLLYRLSPSPQSVQ